MKRAAVLVALLVLVLVGCGSDRFHSGSIGGGYTLVRIPYEGGTVQCIKMHFGASSNGAYGGLSCDFAEFHHYGAAASTKSGG